MARLHSQCANVEAVSMSFGYIQPQNTATVDQDRLPVLMEPSYSTDPLILKVHSLEIIHDRPAKP